MARRNTTAAAAERADLASLAAAGANFHVKLIKIPDGGGAPWPIASYESVDGKFVLGIEEEAKRKGGPGKYKAEVYINKAGVPMPEFVDNKIFAVPTDPTSMSQEEDMAKADAAKPQWQSGPAYGAPPPPTPYGSPYAYPPPMPYPYPYPSMMPPGFGGMFNASNQQAQPPPPAKTEPDPMIKVLEANLAETKRAFETQAAAFAAAEARHAEERARADRDRDRVDADRKIDEARREAKDRADKLEATLAASQRDVLAAIKESADKATAAAAAVPKSDASTWTPLITAIMGTAAPLITAAVAARGGDVNERERLRAQADQNFRDMINQTIASSKEQVTTLLALARQPGQEKISELLGSFAGVMQTTLEASMSMARATAGDSPPPWLQVTQQVLEGIGNLAAEAVRSRAGAEGATGGGAATTGQPALSGATNGQAALSAGGADPFATSLFKPMAAGVRSVLQAIPPDLKSAAEGIVEWAEIANRYSADDPWVKNFFADPAGVIERIVLTALPVDPGRYDATTKVIEFAKEILRGMAAQGDDRIPAAFIAVAASAAEPAAKA